MDDQRTAIRAFVTRHLNGVAFTDEQDLFATGYVNSLFAVQIVMFVEGTLGIPVAGDDLDIRNFTSVDRIVGFVGGKRAGLAARS
jgi:acyl carrier protein